MRYTLRKAEKLRHKSLVDSLFSQGNSLYDFPLRLVWRVLTPEELKASFRADIPPATGPLQMLITIPKKKRRRAVDRVLLRRRIREAYRLNRLPLLDVIKERAERGEREEKAGSGEKAESGEKEKKPIGTLSLAFIFLGNENTPYADIEKKMIRLLSRLKEKI